MQKEKLFAMNFANKKLFPILSTEELVLSQDSSDIRFLIEGAFGVPMKAVEQTLEQCQLLNLKSVTYVNPVQYNPRYSNIKYLNEVPISQMYGVYKQHDILIKMSRVEALALPPIEAFHAGCTAILSKVTGSEEYVKDGFNSMQVEVDDFAGLREKIKLIQNDNELLLTLKKGAIKTASEWPDINTTANEFASICFTILASEKLGNIKINDPIGQMGILNGTPQEIADGTDLQFINPPFVYGEDLTITADICLTDGTTTCIKCLNITVPFVPSDDCCVITATGRVTIVYKICS
jgi:hypothetical protein